MLDSTRQLLLDAIGPDRVVLDVGGWADPFERADWVIDLMPYESRGLYAREGWVEPRTGAERFTADSWIQRDICSREPFPFADGEIDFVICSQTLEDMRDPVWVCSEMNRIAGAGYIEVPSRLEEQSWGVNGPFVGWSHHRWLVDVADGGIEFVQKLHSLHSRPEQYFPAGFWESLSEEERIQRLWWTGGFAFRERVIVDETHSYVGGFDRYMSEFVSQELAVRGAQNHRRAGWAARVRALPRRIRGLGAGRA